MVIVVFEKLAKFIIFVRHHWPKEELGNKFTDKHENKPNQNQKALTLTNHF